MTFFYDVLSCLKKSVQNTVKNKTLYPIITQNNGFILGSLYQIIDNTSTINLTFY